MSTISFNRIGLLIKRQVFEHSRVYLVGSTLLVVVLAFLFAVTYHWRDSFSGGVRNGIFLIGLFAGGGLFTNSLFNELSTKSRGMWLLTIPASAGEKILTAAFFAIVIFPLVYITVFSVIDLLYIMIVGSSSGTGRVDFFRNGFYEFFFTYFSFSGLIALGSVYFGRASFVKSMLVILCLFFVVTTGNNFILQFMTGLPVVTSNTPFESFQFRNNGENIYVRMPAASGPVLAFIFRIIVPLTLWYIACVRLKEKEF